MLGGGGSILTVPVLVYVLGYSVKTAIPMSLAVVGLTSVAGVVGHARAGTVHWRAALAFGPPAVVGAFGGAHLGLVVSPRLQLTIFAVIMLLAAGSMWFGQLLWMRGGAPPGAPAPRPLAMVGILGAGVGLLTGLIGIGGGFLYVPALVLLAGLDMRAAVGTSLVLITLSAASGFARYSGAVALDWVAIGGFTALAFVGVWVGAGLVRHLSQQALRRGFALLVLVMGAVVLLFGR